MVPVWIRSPIWTTTTFPIGGKRHILHPCAIDWRGGDFFVGVSHLV